MLAFERTRDDIFRAALGYPSQPRRRQITSTHPSTDPRWVVTAALIAALLAIFWFSGSAKELVVRPEPVDAEELTKLAATCENANKKVIVGTSSANKDVVIAEKLGKHHIMVCIDFLTFPLSGKIEGGCGGDIPEFVPERGVVIWKDTAGNISESVLDLREFLDKNDNVLAVGDGFPYGGTIVQGDYQYDGINEALADYLDS